VAYGINDQGIAVGWAQRADGIQRAVSWGAKGILDLGSLAKDGCSLATNINSKGVIVGSSCTVAAGVRGARFRAPDEIDDLGSLGGTTLATAINDSGIIVGYSYVPSGVYHAFVYADGKMIDAGTLPGMDRSQLAAVNSAGVAVGFSSNGGEPTPVIYAGGRLADLSALVDTTAYTLGSASGIDDEGNIVATARLSGWWRAVLLRPK
jgi:probable HAF family extracellular repeat protein